MADNVIVGIEAKDKTKEGVDKAKRNLRGINVSAQNAMNFITGPAGLAAGAIAAVGAGAFKAISDFAAAADGLSKLSQKTGVSAEELSKLSHAYDQSGLSSGDLERTLRRLTERMGQSGAEGRAIKANVESLGYAYDELSGKTPIQKLNNLIQTLSRASVGTSDYNTAVRLAGVTSEEFAEFSPEDRFLAINSALTDGLPKVTKFEEGLVNVGLSFDDIKNLSPDEQFSVISEAISKLENVQERAAAASDLFGKKLGPDLLPLLEGGADGLREMGEEAESLGIVISQETADIGAEFGDTVDEIGKTFQGAFQGILTAVLPIVTQLLKAFLSLLQGGGQVGEGLKRVWDFIVDVVKFAVNLYVAYIKDLVFNFVSLIQNGINGFLDIIETGLNFGKGLFVGFVNGVIGFIEGLVNGVIDLLVGFLEPHNAGLNWHFINPIIEGLNNSRADFGRLSIEETVLGRVDFLSNLETIGITGGHIESVFQGGLPVLDLSNLATPETNININVEGSVLSENDLATVVNRGRQLGTIY